VGADGRANPAAPCSNVYAKISAVRSNRARTSRTMPTGHRSHVKTSAAWSTRARASRTTPTGRRSHAQAPGRWGPYRPNRSDPLAERRAEPARPTPCDSPAGPPTRNRTRLAVPPDRVLARVEATTHGGPWHASGSPASSFSTGSDSRSSSTRPTRTTRDQQCYKHPSVSRGTSGGDIVHPQDRLGSLPHYATHQDVSPGASGFLRVDRPLIHLGASLGTYRRKLNGVTVHQAFVTWPGSPGARSGLRTGDLPRAVSCGRSEGAVLGYANPAVAVCLHEPGSPGRITSLVGLMAALGAPGAVVCFARGFLHVPALGGR